MFYYYGNDTGESTRARMEASSARASAADAKTTAQFLQKEVDRLMLTCEALWELLKTKLEVSDQDLMEQMMRLDLSDGKADGKVSKGPLTCPECEKNNARRHERCIYCGTALRSRPFD